MSLVCHSVTACRYRCIVAQQNRWNGATILPLGEVPPSTGKWTNCLVCGLSSCIYTAVRLRYGKSRCRACGAGGKVRRGTTRQGMCTVCVVCHWCDGTKLAATLLRSGY